MHNQPLLPDNFPPLRGSKIAAKLRVRQKSMKLGYKLTIGYLALVGIIFLFGYWLAGVRELGLYLFLIIINLPSSFIVIPQMEMLSLDFGLTLGKAPHVFLTQLMCMTVNGAFLFFIVLLFHRFKDKNDNDV